MATLLDTSAFVAFLRRRPPRGAEGVREAALAEIRSQAAAASAVTLTELLVGARDADAQRSLADLLGRLPVVAADSEVADLAGRMGRVARAEGRTLPLADLLIAATAVHLGIPLLTCDSDFARGRALADEADEGDPWRALSLHPASSIG